MNEPAQSLRQVVRELRIELRILNDAIAESAGLNPRDLDILDVIDREGPCTPSQLATRTGTRRATLTSVLARLESQGWVQRTVDDGDKRSAVLTSTGRFGELEALYTLKAPNMTQLGHTFTNQDLNATTRVLTAITQHLRTRLPN